ncbi:glycosyltransferase family protein [Novosphingobium ginsenosidimutans]|uniref:Glycosyltransferase family 4 protein n=1 Tax=Novosphingobium ginsenosidimutans TaxID=1176536 RepID=A0A5B8S4Z1_9SPHN|nr:glycosyltransferase [Novosphingobium ginsenosidimutans]QEA15817.1 glycosyltransferase family 4 protein [Novosphingobium ginsenosidimutans]
MSQPQALLVFLFDLIQDINVLRPIVRVLAQETPYKILLLRSNKLPRRDRTGVWQAELAELASLSMAELGAFDSPRAVYERLQGGRGLVFSASETDLPAHETNHEAFKAVPNTYVRVTVQHGHECVGFRQNVEQTIAHGESVRFAADVLCGWGPLESMTHLVSSERTKFVELGPPMVLDRLYNRRRAGEGQKVGLVCENLHSVRMRTTGDFQTAYIDTIRKFAASQAEAGRRVALRPHPGGQFVLKNNVELPGNLDLANAAMYKTDLARFAYGISAPSSVLIDMVMADIPTAVWQDADGQIDTSGYAGLAKVSSVEDWIAFAEDAVADPAPFRARQQEFLERSHLSVAPEVVRDRLLSLVQGLLSERVKARPRRVLLIANGVIPTLKISFIKPLEPMVDAGLVELTVLTEADIKTALGKANPVTTETSIARALVDPSMPDLAVFCRYSGPLAAGLMAELKASNVPVMLHIDDDLLHVPPEIGPKHVEHNRPERTGAVRTLLQGADLVYASTEKLQQRLAALGFSERVSAGAVYCSGEVAVPAERSDVTVIGFMGNDKAPELEDLVPALVEILDANPQVRFELFGSMAMPSELQSFGNRVHAIPRVSDYDAFVETFRQLRWQIGLAPLRPTPFNVVKADTKWVDYTSIGTAVIASAGTAYDRCCADGCGLLVEDTAGWRVALQSLIDDPDRRVTIVKAAQRKLAQDYSPWALTRQVLEKFDLATRMAAPSRA